MNTVKSRFNARLRWASPRYALFQVGPVLVIAWLVGGGLICFGQPAPQAEKARSDQSCGRGHDFEREGYSVRSSRIEDPFDFLPWVRLKERRAAQQIAALVDGKPFTYDAALHKATEIIEKENFLPDPSDFRFSLRVELVSVENCADHKLDLVYGIYSTQILPVLSGTPEARATERQAPESAAGMTDVTAPAVRPVHLMPLAGYDSENKMFAGGRLEVKAKRSWKGPFDSMVIEGKGSSRLRYIAAELSGAADPDNWLAHVEWRLNYTNYSLPTGAGNIGGGHLSAQASGMTKPLADGNLTARFGALLEGGNRQSDIRDISLAPDTLDSTAFGALKLYAGLNGRFSRHVFSIAYGLQLGAVGPSARVDWRKHIGDVRHEFWYPLGDHRILDLESRFTVGGIQVPGQIPLSERFFGGNNEEAFIPGDSWQMRQNPVIRAIPGSRLFRTADGAGGDRFFSYNLTAAYAVWRQPLTPGELTNSEEFDTVLQDSLDRVTRNVKRTYLIKDPHYVKMTEQHLPKVAPALDRVKAAVGQVLPSPPPAPAAACQKTINTAIRRVKNAVETPSNYSTVVALLAVSADEGDNWLGQVVDCVRELNKPLQNADVTRAIDDFDLIRRDMEAEFQQIDQNKAQHLADAEMKFTRQTVNTIFHDVNIYSISPVFVFDVARLSPERNGVGGMRYGPGVGLRLELVSTVHFTAGYAWNVNRGRGEGSGTVFFSLGVRDLFR